MVVESTSVHVVHISSIVEVVASPHPHVVLSPSSSETSTLITSVEVVLHVTSVISHSSSIARLVAILPLN